MCNNIIFHDSFLFRDSKMRSQHHKRYNNLLFLHLLSTFPINQTQKVEDFEETPLPPHSSCRRTPQIPLLTEKTSRV